MGYLIGYFIFVIVATILSPRFLTPTNILNIVRQVSIFGILAIGQTFVIITAGIDLSVGAILALVVVITGGLLPGFGIPIAITAGLLVGTGIGSDKRHWRNKRRSTSLCYDLGHVGNCPRVGLYVYRRDADSGP